MMTTLRNQMKAILWVLVIAFLATIIFSWGMGGFSDSKEKPGVIGVIAGEEITYEAFDRFVQRKQEAEVEKQGAQFDENKIKQLREDTWDEEVERLLKSKDAERLGVNATDAEIAYIVQNFPPNEVREVPAFQREGAFAPDLYQNFLRTPDAKQFLFGLEASVRNYLTEQKMLFQVNLACDVSETDVKDEYMRGVATGKLNFVFLPYDKAGFDTSSITEEMKKKYYSLFPDKFKQYGQRRFAYTKFKVEPTATDSSDVFTLAQELISELKSGADFAELAKIHSEDAASAEKGGDLDWVTRGAMAKPFEDAAFAAAPGDIVGPVASKFGIHIINVLEKQSEKDGEEKVRARHILLKIKASPDTRDIVYNSAYSLAQDAQQNGFAKATSAIGVKVDTTKAFSESGYIAGLGRMRMAAEFSFNNPIGTVSEVYPIPDGYVVFEIVEATEESIKPYVDVKDAITKSLVKILKNQKVVELAASMRAKMGSPEELGTVASTHGYTVYTTEDTMKVDGKLPEGLRADKDFLKEAFRLNEGELSGVIEGRNGCYIAHMVSKTPFNKEEFETNHFAIYNALLMKEQENIAKNWVRELRIAGDIQDNRFKYYRDF